MKGITINNVVNAVGGKLLCGNGDDLVTSVTTDSRDNNADLFIALKGERFDANDFVSKYLECNKSAMVSRGFPQMADKNIIYVKDTSAALLKLAAYYRSLFEIPFVAVTGSVGKTSTKEMLYSVLSQNYNTLKTDGNFNNEIGVPLTLFGLESSHQCAVVEMGMSNFGEVSRLTSAVRPDIAVITNIGTAHIGNLGSRDNILKAKLEITEGMTDSGILVLNGDDELLWGIKGTVAQKTIYFGIDNKNADVVAENINMSQMSAEFTIGKTRFLINAPGRHNIYNALAAYAVGTINGLAVEQVAKGVKQFKNCGMRQNIIKLGEVTLIEDCYNASYDSVKASLSVLKSVANGRTVAVLGDILEQGDFAEEIHNNLGKAVRDENIDFVITVGNDARRIADFAKNAVSFDNAVDAAEKMEDLLKPGDTVLVKGSRGVHLETVCDKVKEIWKDN